MSDARRAPPGSEPHCAPPWDFDRVVERRCSDSLKWDRYTGRDVLPMWVADMDFPSPPAVIEALAARVAHGVFGYTLPGQDLVEAVLDHLRDQFDWAVEPAWLVWLPGLVCGLNATCRAIGGPGDRVATSVPVYPPFLSAPGNQGRTLATAPMGCSSGRWTFDFAALQSALAAPTRLFLLCSPHNPLGRVFTTEELRQVARLCSEHDVVLCSDEIHNGLVLEPGVTHRPTATLGPAVAERTITLLAPSKTFNLPGLGCAFAVISNPALRRRFRRALEGIVPHVNTLGLTAAAAAYRHSETWRRDLITYLRGNRDRLVEAVAQIPGLRTWSPEATYLAWIDARGLGRQDPAAAFEAAGLGLSDGAEFGAPGFVRFNFGCPRSLLEEGLARLRRGATGPVAGDRENR